MKALLALLIIIALILIGCSSKEADKQYAPSVVPEVIEQTPKQIVSEEAPKEQPKAPEKCGSNTSEDYITHIDLNIFAEGLNKTENGFSFRLIPLDINNNTVPATGNIGLTIFSTKWWNNELVKDLELYKKSIYLKKEEVSPDCSSKEIFISFDDLKKQDNYRFVKNDDPGYLRVEFKRAYSNDLYEIEYSPYDHNEDIIP